VTKEVKPSGPQIIRLARARKRKGLLLKLGLLLAVSGAIGAFVWKKKNEDRDLGPRFVTAEVVHSDLRETVTATGTLKGLDTVDVGAQISGRVLKVLVDFNDKVTVGQALVEMDPAQLSSRVEQSRAQVSAADASVKLAKATIAQAKAQAARARDMATKGLLSSKDLEAAEADAARADASLASSQSQATLARASLKDAQTSLGYSTIRSPIDGVVLSRQIEPGQTVAASLQAPVLFTLARDLTQLRLFVNIDEADVGKVKEGQAATFSVDAWSNRKFNSNVVLVHNLPTAGQTVVTYRAVLSVDNGERLLRPGMTATATIVTADKRGVMTVPDAALRFVPKAAPREVPSAPGLPFMPMTPPRVRGGGNMRMLNPAPQTPVDNQGVVFVLEGNTPSRRVIEIGGTDGTSTEVVTGPLQLGEQVITDQQQQAKP
jgi:HlyD family secretion protein